METPPAAAPDSSTSARDPAPAGELEAENCWFATASSWPETRCYTMQVPEDHLNPGGRSIRFPVVRFVADRPDPNKLPLLHLGAGGPGSGMGMEPQNASDWLWINYAEMTTDRGRDLIVIDPRGTGMAEPRLTCDEFIKDARTAFASPLKPDEENRVFAQSLDRCYQRLSKSADLSHYHSKAVAQDMEALRREFDIEQWHLYGVSYATRYALTIARDYPDTVASMILNSAVFPDIRYVQRSAEDFANAFKRAFKYCDDDAECRKAGTNLQSRLESLVAELDENPLTVRTSLEEHSDNFDFVLTGQRLLRVMFQAFYDERFYRSLPTVIAALEKREADPAEPMVRSFMQLILDPTFGDAAGVSHFCFEEAPFIDFEMAAENAASSGSLGSVAASDLHLMQLQCRIWAIPTASLQESKPVQTDVPTLLMHGALDPVLAIEAVEDVRDQLSRHTWIRFPKLAHDVISVSDCAETAAAEFLDDPESVSAEKTLACRLKELGKSGTDAAGSN
ncbi:alpha/beta fold hydrolase [Biformimicrobium ophioploci]|uniref:Alpha/beta fold hydrolase n=1 Tax=Biformimicrobium ophioploci TaxID=3036711 RepID=A0ABQ6M1H2_9GAMM|nr:alpha/beta fold hydrolase [Microbulbifer sp. NKW57]